MTQAETETDPKKRIWNAAIDLFYRKGFSATGVRELAQKADVNIAMINYYFGSKKGVLEAIVKDFFTSYRDAVEIAISSSGSPKQRIELFVNSVIEVFSDNPKLVKIFFTELPYEMPEFAEKKAAMIRQLIEAIKSRLEDFMPFDSVDPHIRMTLFPGMATLMASHFLVKPIVSNIGLADVNKEFYRKYPHIISDLITGGLFSVIENSLEGKYEKEGKESQDAD